MSRGLMLLLVIALLLGVTHGRIEKGIFCEACDLLKTRYCFEQRCDRSHFCFKTKTASGCSNPYMHTIQECRNMHRGDCCFARQDLHGKRFNTSDCVHDIPQVMCHSCTRMGGCKPVSCSKGNLCYSNRFESGCANTSSLKECRAVHGNCCEGRTSLRSWNAPQCQAELAPLCETCPLQQATSHKLVNCTSATCPGLCFIRRENVTSLNKGTNYTTEHVETGCASSHLSVNTCNNTHQHCCTSHNNTSCYYNYTPNTVSAEVRFFIAFFSVLGVMAFMLCLCFSDTDIR